MIICISLGGAYGPPYSTCYHARSITNQKDPKALSSIAKEGNLMS